MGMKYDRYSPDNKVGFIEKYHRYVYIDDPSIRFTSVTTVAHKYAEPFDAEKIVDNIISRGNSKSRYYGKSREEILEMWNNASKRGTMLHDVGEKLLLGKDVELPNDAAAKYIPQAVVAIFNMGYKVAGVEALFYDVDALVAGLSDIILYKKIDEYTNKFAIYDWKFILELQKKSFFNIKTRKYKKMSGPFKYLDDCNWIHYSIQLALYQTLSGDPDMIKEKVLVVVNEDGFKFEPCYPMRVFWDEYGELQAVYQIYSGKWYDSRVDKLSKNKPEDINEL